MKQCSQCTKAATFHITEIRKGVAKPIHLCEGCAKEYLALVDVSSKPTASLAKHKGLKLQDSPSDHLACSHCGQTFRQFRSQGRIGCAHDYDLFREELLQLLESIHGNTQHVGKVPKQHGAAGQSEAQLLRLRSELKAAVEAEDYEKAVELRDEISQLEKSAGHASLETESTSD
jgi:protein arginine kinase activator